MRKLLMILIVVLGLYAQAVAQSPDELIAVRNAYAAAMDAHDIDAMLSYWVDDCTYDLVNTPPPGEGKDPIRAGFEQRFTAFPDFHGDDGIVLAAGNIVVVDHNMVGTHAALGKAVIGPHLDIYEFQGNKIKKATTYVDQVIQMVQLGLMPAPDMPPLVPSIAVPDPEATGLSALEANAEAAARWSNHDPAHSARMYHSNASIMIGPLGMKLNRVEMTALNETYFQGFSDARIEPVRTIDMGDGWILFEYAAIGTHDGSFMGVPASGYPAEIRCVWLTHYDADGLITQQSVHYDNMTLITQMTTAPWPLDGIWITSAPSSFGNLLSKTLYVSQDAARTRYSGTLEFINAFPFFTDLYPDGNESLTFSAGGQAAMVGRNKYEATYLGYERKFDASTGIMEIVGIYTLKAYFEVTGPDQLQGDGPASYYMAAQDADQDGFPDEGEVPVVCFPWQWTSKRLTAMPGCTPATMP